MIIEYGNSEFTQAQRNLIEHRRSGLLISRSKYYLESVLVTIFFGLAAYAAYSAAEGPFLSLLALVFTVCAVASLYRWRPYDRWLKNSYFPASLDRQQQRIRLELAADGLHEHQGDIVSFAPWKDVTDASVEEDLLIIKLSNGEVALVPRQSPGIPDLNLEDIRDEIHRRRTPND